MANIESEIFSKYFSKDENVIYLLIND